MSSDTFSRDLKFILATDIDNTLTGDPAALRKLNNLLSTQRDKIKLIYLTGRHLSSMCQIINEENLLQPDIAVTDVGTRIFRGTDFTPDTQWEEKISQNWDSCRISKLLENLSGLVPQKVPRGYRCSYHFTDEPEPIIKRVKILLQNKGIDVQIIVSSGKDLDIIPPNAGKGQALKYLVNKYNWPDQKILVCGDSGNDLDMLLSGYSAVIVGNARDEIKNRKFPNKVYRAQQNHAAGILEAMKVNGLV